MHSALKEQLLGLMEVLLPESVFDSVNETFEDIITKERGGLLSVTVISALYFSTNGLHTLIDSFNTTFHTIESRPYFIQRGISILLTLILTMFTFVAIGLIIFGEMGMDFIKEQGWIEDNLVTFSLNLARWVIILSLMFFAISVLYFLGPAKQTKWRFFSAGSTLATALVLITSIGFSYFVENFGQYNKLYGSIGTLVIVMLWTYFNSIALLIGFELNASIEDAKLRDMELNERTLDISLEEEIEKGSEK